MKLYTASAGNYSDWHILGIFDNKEQAELVQDLHCSDNPIEEWELNKVPAHPPGLVFWTVCMQKDGTTLKVKRISMAWDGPDNVATPCHHDHSLGTPIPRYMEFWHWAKDEQHAVKIANEKRVQLLALNQWADTSEAHKLLHPEYYANPE